jgi:hypothetical protein
MSLNNFVSPPKFEDYKERFKDFYKMERRADGVILVQAHTEGGPIQLSVENHRSVGQMFKTVGADPKNEILIFTGSGDEFMMGGVRPVLVEVSQEAVFADRSTAASTPKWRAAEHVQ